MWSYVFPMVEGEPFFITNTDVGATMHSVSKHMPFHVLIGCSREKVYCGRFLCNTTLSTSHILDESFAFKLGIAKE